MTKIKVKIKVGSGLVCWWVDTICSSNDEFLAILISITNGAVISLPIDKITVIDEEYRR